MSIAEQINDTGHALCFHLAKADFLFFRESELADGSVKRASEGR